MWHRSRYALQLSFYARILVQSYGVRPDKLELLVVCLHEENPRRNYDAMVVPKVVDHITAIMQQRLEDLSGLRAMYQTASAKVSVGRNIVDERSDRASQCDPQTTPTQPPRGQRFEPAEDALLQSCGAGGDLLEREPSGSGCIGHTNRTAPSETESLSRTRGAEGHVTETTSAGTCEPTDGGRGAVRVHTTVQDGHPGETESPVRPHVAEASTATVKLSGNTVWFEPGIADTTELQQLALNEGIRVPNGLPRLMHYMVADKFHKNTPGTQAAATHGAIVFSPAEFKQFLLDNHDVTPQASPELLPDPAGQSKTRKAPHPANE